MDILESYTLLFGYAGQSARALPPVDRALYHEAVAVMIDSILPGLSDPELTQWTIRKEAAVAVSSVDGVTAEIGAALPRPEDTPQDIPEP